MKIDNLIKWLSAGAGAVVGAVTGAWSGVLTCLLVFNVIDYVTGVMCAIAGRSSKTEGGRLSSSAGFVGLARKVLIWALICVATCVDKFVIGTGSSCQTATALFYVANEALSVLENCALLGLPIPVFLRRLLEVLREKNDRGEGVQAAPVAPQESEATKAAEKELDDLIRDMADDGSTELKDE